MNAVSYFTACFMHLCSSEILLNSTNLRLIHIYIHTYIDSQKIYASRFNSNDFIIIIIGIKVSRVYSLTICVFIFQHTYVFVTKHYMHIYMHIIYML